MKNSQKKLILIVNGFAKWGKNRHFSWKYPNFSDDPISQLKTTFKKHKNGNSGRKGRREKTVGVTVLWPFFSLGKPIYLMCAIIATQYYIFHMWSPTSVWALMNLFGATYYKLKADNMLFFFPPTYLSYFYLASYKRLHQIVWHELPN